MVVAIFSVKDKANRIRFFEETFLVANVSPEIVVRIFFLILSGADVDFLGYKLWWRTYITEKAFSTTRHVELVGKKEFAAAVLDLEYETYVVYVVSVSSNTLSSSPPLNIYSLKKPQISGLIAKETPTMVFIEYLDFANVFFLDLAFKFPEHTGINDHTIELVDSHQPSYGSIYSLRPIELETLKAYIETNLDNTFIRPSKSLASILILFERKSDGSLWLCVNYSSLNNLIIKNQYPLPLIEESLDRLRRARRFTQLDLISTYHQMRIRKEDE